MLTMCYTRRGTMAPIPLALDLKPHNVCLWHLPSHRSSIRTRVSVHEQVSLCGTFKRMLGFPAAFLLAWTDRIPTDFHRLMLWGLLFQALVPQVGKTSAGLKLFTPSG